MAPWSRISTAIEAEAPATAEDATEFTLDNGMRFLVIRRGGAPVVSFATCARVGYADDPGGKSGLAHLLEHLAFKGTSRIGTKDWNTELKALDRADAIRRQLRLTDAPDSASELKRELDAAEDVAGKLASSSDFSRLLETAGAVRLTARTNADETVYSVDLPSNRVELWFLLESERFRDPVFREFYKEKNVVAEERKMRVDTNSRGRLMEDLLHVSFSTHPYGSPGIGTPGDLSSLTRDDARAFFQAYYVPSNLTAVLVGDADPDLIRAFAIKYFGRLPAGKPPTRRHVVEAEHETERSVILLRNGPCVVVMGYHKSALAQDQKAAYDVLCSILAQGRTSRLHRKLAVEQSLITSVQYAGSVPGGRDPGLLLLTFTLSDSAAPENVISAVKRELQTTAMSLAGEAELGAARNRARLAWASLRGSNSATAYAYAVWEAQSGSYGDLLGYSDGLERVTSTQVRNVAASMFGSDKPEIAIIDRPTATPNDGGKK